MSLTANEHIVLSAIRDLVPSGRGRLAQAEIRTRTGRSLTGIRTALNGLESKGLIKREKPLARHLATWFVVANVSSPEQFQDVPLLGELPNCFRMPDYINPGHLWNNAPKDVWHTRGQLEKFAVTRTPSTLAKHLTMLAELPARVLTVKTNPAKRHGNVYMFHHLTPSDEAAVFEHLNSRLKPWRGTTKEQAAAEHAKSKERWTEQFGTAAYSELAPGVLAMTKPGPEYRGLKLALNTEGKATASAKITRCLLYDGPLSKGGYGKVDGVQVPGIMAHRIVYHHHHGSIPAGQEVHHRCRNRSCVNVDHLVAMYPDDHRRNFTAWGNYHHRVREVNNRHQWLSDEWRAAMAAAETSLARQTALDAPIGTARPIHNSAA